MNNKIKIGIFENNKRDIINIKGKILNILNHLLYKQKVFIEEVK